MIIADASFWRKKPAIIVYDIKSATARRLLQARPSVSAEDFVIRNQNQIMSFAGGIVSLRGGIDGIALGKEWLYYAALSGSNLYRVKLADLTDPSAPRLGDDSGHLRVGRQSGHVVDPIRSQGEGFPRD